MVISVFEESVIVHRSILFANFLISQKHFDGTSTKCFDKLKIVTVLWFLIS